MIYKKNENRMLFRKKEDNMAKKTAKKDKKKEKHVKSSKADKVAENTIDTDKKILDKGHKKEPKLKKNLSEHTSFKNVNKKKTKKRQAVWVKKFTLEYEEELNQLQIELLKWQKHVIAKEERVLLLFEGRDAAGKGGTIKRISRTFESTWRKGCRTFKAQ